MLTGSYAGVAVAGVVANDFAENDAQPDKFSSIPDAMWWSIITLTTDGDVVPVTNIGRVIVGVVAVMGILSLLCRPVF